MLLNRLPVFAQNATCRTALVSSCCLLLGVEDQTHLRLIFTEMTQVSITSSYHGNNAFFKCLSTLNLIHSDPTIEGIVMIVNAELAVQNLPSHINDI